VQNREILHTFTDDEIKLLTSQKLKIDQELAMLKHALDSTNPNVQILFHYRQKKRDHEIKTTELKGLEGSLTSKRNEHDSLKEKRHK
jgi:structural maintenance of chromosome 4